MQVQEAIEVAAVGLTALGGGVGIVFAFSNWLGKVWADRIMTNERAAHDRALATLRSDLEVKNQSQLATHKTELDLHADRQRVALNDRLSAYRQAIDLITDILADFDRISATGIPETGSRYFELNRRRLQAYCYLGMIAPQAVMDKFDSLFDYMLEVAKGIAPHDFPRARALGLQLLQAVRDDLVVGGPPLKYSGRY